VGGRGAARGEGDARERVGNVWPHSPCCNRSRAFKVCPSSAKYGVLYNSTSIAQFDDSMNLINEDSYVS
jgi:hypothetical protein